MDIDSAVAAARAGNLETICAWLQSGADPDEHDAEGWTPLLAACARGRADLVHLLINHDLRGVRRADPDVPFVPAAALPVYMAGQSGDLRTVQVLLGKRPNHLFATCGVNGHTVLLQATFYGSARHEALARHLLENVGGILQLPDDDAVREARRRLLAATNVRGFNAIGMARLWGNRAIEALLLEFDEAELTKKRYLSSLLDRIAPVPDMDDPAQRATEAVLAAIEQALASAADPRYAESHAIDQLTSESVALLQDLTSRPEFDIDRLGGRLKQTPIIVTATGVDAHEGVSRIRRAIAAFLLDNGADPDIEELHPMGVDAVIRAAVLNHLYLLELLAEHMPPDNLAAAMNRKPPVNGLTALHDSVHRALTAKPGTLENHIEQIRWMVAHGARSDIEDHTGKTQAQLARDALGDANFRANAEQVLAALGVGEE